MSNNSVDQVRPVFFVSDGTGLTAEAYGRSLLAQFPDVDVDSQRLPFVETEQRARQAVETIQQAYQITGQLPIVFCTLVDPLVQQRLAAAQACVIDLFQTFIGPLEQALGTESAHTQGLSHQVVGKQGYLDRLNAVEFTLQHDDGVRPDQYADAELVLVGVSRCGKTPTSLYIAMNFSIPVANYPLIEDDLGRDVLPELLQPWRERLVGLTLDPRQLSSIRQQRRPGSEYASLAVCQRDIRAAARIFAKAGMPVFDMTDTSIEEVASQILKIRQVDRY